MDRTSQRAETEAMRRIPFTGAVILTASDQEAVASDFLQAIQALEDTAALNFTLLKDWMAAEAKVREYANLIVQQSTASQQIMQINGHLAGAIGRIRAGDDPEVVTADLEAQLAEFGGEAPAE